MAGGWQGRVFDISDTSWKNPLLPASCRANSILLRELDEPDFYPPCGFHIPRHATAVEHNSDPVPERIVGEAHQMTVGTVPLQLLNIWRL